MALKHRKLFMKWALWTPLWAAFVLPLTALGASLPGGAKSVKIIFKSENFTLPATPSLGTNPSLGDATGSAAWARRFHPTSSTGGSTTTPPPWLSGVSVTLAGTNNSGSRNTACGNFAETGVSNSTQCNFVANTPSAQFACNGPDQYFRVSEYDCADLGGTSPFANTAIAGSGLPTDPVAIKIFLNRDSSKLGATENLMVVLEYQASGLKMAPKNAQSCLTGGEPQLSNTDCVDHSYSLYTRALNATTPHKLQTLIPPQGGKVNATDQTFGGPIQTRQIIIPLSSLDSDQTVLQISRTFGLPGSADPQYDARFGTHCESNSPLCVGLVLYSISIFRI
jgi:hypothetical protein